MNMTKDQIMEKLRRERDAAGSAAAWARKNGISVQYVCDVLNDRREPGAKILDALGLETVVSYRRKGAKA